MNLPIPTSKISWSASGRLARVRPRPSRRLLAWWSGVHGLAALGLALSAVDPLWRILALGVLLIHAHWRFPRPIPDLLRSPAGDWAVPALDRAGLRLAEESRDGGWWLELVLTDDRGSLIWLLIEDQLESDVWLALRGEVAGGCQIKSS